MAVPNKVAAYTSVPVPRATTDGEEQAQKLEPSYFSHMKPRASKRPSDGTGNSVPRASKRVSSSTTIENLSEPFFKNIKYYTSKKLRAISSGSQQHQKNSEDSKSSNLQKLVTNIQNESVDSPVLSSPTTPLRAPGLCYQDDETPKSSISPKTPGQSELLVHTQYPTGGSFLINDPVSKRLFRSELQCIEDELKIGALSLKTSTHPIFEIPEIVHRILDIYDSQNSSIPHEQAPVRRIPLSYEHALLIHRDEALAKQVWHESQNLIQKGNDIKAQHALSSCLTVNKLWYRISNELMQKNCYFDDDMNWLKYAASVNQRLKSSNYKKPAPESFVLHKLTHIKQKHLDLVVAATNYKNLKWLELYICPKVLPSVNMITANLTRLVITGSKVLDDEFLINWAPKLTKLEILDLRACDLITDSGIYAISLNCPKLKLLNVGRQSRGELVSDASICSIIKNTQISTLGVAGCGITDRTIWELAINRAGTLERLSLNNCKNLTNESLPRTIHYFRRLSVLEIRHCMQITNVRPLVEFKRHQMSKKINVLVEGCELIEQALQREETAMDIEVSKNILEDITEWCNSNSDVE